MIVPHKLIGIALSLLILLFCSMSLQAQQKITIAVDEWPPYLSQDLKHSGVIAHMITDVFHDIGIEAIIEFRPWARAYNDTLKGLHSATAIWMDKEERRVDFIYSNPVLEEQFVFFHQTTLPFDWSSIDDLKTFTIGGVYASSYGPEFDQALSTGKLKIERVNQPEQNFKKMLKKRIQLFPFERHVGNSIIKKYFSAEEQQQITYNPKPLLNNLSFLLFPKSLESSQTLADKFNQQLQIIRDNGKYNHYFEKLKQGYYDKPIEPLITP